MPEGRQADIFRYLQEHSIRDTVAWLARNGVETSRSALSEFFTWYDLNRQFRQNEETTKQVVDELKREVPNISDEQLDALAQRTFTLMCIRDEDAKTFLGLQRVKFLRRRRARTQ